MPPHPQATLLGDFRERLRLLNRASGAYTGRVVTAIADEVDADFARALRRQNSLARRRLPADLGAPLIR